MRLHSIYKISLNHYKQHVIQSILLIMGIALGVSVIIAIDIANINASSSFQNSLRRLNGNITHSIHSVSDRIDEAIYFDIRKKLGYEGFSPIIEKEVKLYDFPDLSYRIVGIDPFSDSRLTGFFQNNGLTLNSESFEYFLSGRNVAIVGPEFGEQYDLHPGDNFNVSYEGNSVQLKVGGIFDPVSTEKKILLADKVFVDISTAQEIFNYAGFLTRIDINLGSNSSIGELNIRKYLETNFPGVYMVKNSKLADENKKLTEAFGLNLKALSLITILVAFFLIYNTFNYSLVVRRPVYSILRSIGVTPNEIFKLIIVEAFIVGLIGCITGVLIGLLLGNLSIELVKKTYSDIYDINSAILSDIPVYSIFKSVIIGISSVLAAAMAPSIESRYIKPVNIARTSFLESAFGKVIPKMLVVGLLMVFTGLIMSFDTGLSIEANFVILFVLIIGYVLSLPYAMKIMGEALHLIQRFISKRLYLIASKNYLRGIGTNFAATASLVVAVSVFFSMTVLIHSFRTTLSRWLDDTFDSDVFISAPGDKNGLEYDVLDKLSQINGITDIGYSRNIGIITEDYGLLNLLALSDNPPLKPQISEKMDTLSGTFIDLADREVLISESFYLRNKDKLIDGTLSLPTTSGISTFIIKGVYSDFATQKSTLVMKYDTFKKNWDDNRLTSVSFNIIEGFDREKVIQAVDSNLSDIKSYKITRNIDLKNAAYKIFDQTFVITKAMRLIAFMVAFFGILGSLLCLELSKNKQIGILRSVGARVSDIKKLIIMETGLVGVISGVLSIPLGLIVSYLLVKVINYKSFGWTIDFLVVPSHILEALLLSVIAALLAGIYPAYIFSNLKIHKLLIQE